MMTNDDDDDDDGGGGDDDGDDNNKHTGRMWWPLHYQDNHADKAVILDSESAIREYPGILSRVRWESL